MVNEEVDDVEQCVFVFLPPRPLVITLSCEPIKCKHAWTVSQCVRWYQCDDDRTRWANPPADTFRQLHSTLSMMPVTHRIVISDPAQILHKALLSFFIFSVFFSVCPPLLYSVQPRTAAATAVLVLWLCHVELSVMIAACQAMSM